MERDEQFMRLALEEARRAEAAGEVPVGAVVVIAGEVAARSGNRTLTDCDPTAHAEIVALRAAAKTVAKYRLSDATLYVTLEPCAMCAGAMIQARLTRVVYGADDPKGGAVRSCFSILNSSRLNHRLEITSGVLAEECAALLQTFFTARR
jgi:tRNA(adenine34) deaminase